MFEQTPSIGWINANAGSNGLNVISTFAGAGGSSTGYKWAGFKVLVACEFIKEAVETYEANAPSTIVVPDDIRGVSGRDLLGFAGLEVGQLDVLDGSPPCSAFSMAGLREDGWGVEKHYSGEVSQRVDDLFLEYVRLIDEIRPKVFVAENVPGMVIGAARGYFAEVWSKLSGLGYEMAAQVIAADQLGVPQVRRRLIIQGVRRDLGKSPCFPHPYSSRPVSVREAIAGLPAPERADYDILRDGTRTRMAWEYTDVVRDGGCFRFAYQRLYGKDARYMWFKVNPAKPCPTITAKIPTLFRWDEPRTLSIPEVKRLSSFPDDFVVTGKFKPRWERIGRAVPPRLMMEVAKAIAQGVFDR